MFKKLLSTLTVMLFVFGMNANAQDLHKANLGKVTPKFAGKNIVTSKINLAESEFWTGFWDGIINEYTGLVGVQKIPMDYACAIKYPAGAAITDGKTIEGIKFSFPDSKYITNVKVFIATELPPTTDKANITCQDVMEITDILNTKDQFNEVRFEKPYKVDPSKPVFIGYSFRVTDGSTNAENYPIMIQQGEDKKDAMWLNFGSNQWEDYYGSGFGVLAIQVLMSGSFEDNNVTIAPDLGSVTGTKGSSDLPIVVENSGIKGIESITAEVDVNGIKTEVESKPETPIKGIGDKYAFTAKINTPEETGVFDFTVKITKINGQVLSKDIIGKGKMVILTRFAAHKVLFEEFTGMWCGWCPRGMVAIEKIKDVYKDKVVIISAHKDDALSCTDYNKIINSFAAGFPSACLDRTITTDPYDGTEFSNFGIKLDIDKLLATIPVAEIVSKPFLEGDILTANAEVNFLYTGDASNYAIGYVLTHDGMQDESWSQANYISGDNSWVDLDPLFEPWAKAGENVSGVVFNEVAITANGIKSGIEGSIPVEVKEETPVIHSVEFDLSKLNNIQNRENLNVAVILFDTKTGAVVNSDIMSVKGGTTGIEEIEDECENVIETARYTVDGRRIITPEKGLNIVKYSDGTVKKIIVK